MTDLTKPEDIAHGLQAALRFLTATVIVLAIGLGLTVWYMVDYAHSNRQALCAVRLDAEGRVEVNDQSLKDNPNGAPGVSVEQLQRSTANFKRTVKALEHLDCEAWR